MHMAKSILAATDFSPCGDAAIESAFALAAVSDANVHLLHVFTSKASHDDDEFDLVQASERSAEHHLRNAAQVRASSVRRGKVLLRRGDPASLIMETAREVGADLLIVGTHDRRGLDRLRLGSVAEKVVCGAPCSVLVVRAPMVQSG